MLFMGIVGYFFYLNYRSVLLKAAISSNRHSVESYSDVKYKNLENDVSLESLTNKEKNSIKNNINNNIDQRKYSLEESAEEGL